MTFDVASALLQSQGKKKKKQYLLYLFARTDASDKDMVTLEKAADAAINGYIYLHVDDPDEALNVLLIKSVDLVIIDTLFLGSEELTIEFAEEIKKRKKCPIFFVTHNEKKLITEYRDHLFMYDELDDYINSPVDFLEGGKRLKRMLHSSGRSAKRFLMQTPAMIYRLNEGIWHKGIMTDLSIVGFGFYCFDYEKIEMFSRNEQIMIKISMNEFDYFHPEFGEYLRLSAKVQRIGIEGKNVGCSIEHLTPLQNEILLKILAMVNKKKKQLVKTGPKLQAPKPIV